MKNYNLIISINIKLVSTPNPRPDTKCARQLTFFFCFCYSICVVVVFLLLLGHTTVSLAYRVLYFRLCTVCSQTLFTVSHISMCATVACKVYLQYTNVCTRLSPWFVWGFIDLTFVNKRHCCYNYEIHTVLARLIGVQKLHSRQRLLDSLLQSHTY